MLLTTQIIDLAISFNEDDFIQNHLLLLTIFNLSAIE